MESTAFPSKEMRQFASFEARLKDDLSLQDIEEIEKQIVLETTDKTRGVAVGLLNRFEARKPALIERQITKIEEASDLLSKIEYLTPLIDYLDPDVVNERLDKIQFEASLASDPKVQDAVAKKLKHLQFAQAKPLVRDLKDFVGRLETVAAQVLNTNSLAPLFSEFNNVQISQINQAITAGR